MDLLSSLRRRWIIATLLLLLTVIAVGGALFKLPTTYQAQASVVFLAPKNLAKPYGGNPWLAFNSTLNQTADVVRYETIDVRTQNMLAAQGYNGTYVITDATDTSGPVLDITVTGHDKNVVENTLRGVTNEIGTKLDSLQAGVSSVSQVRNLVISFTPQAKPVASKKLRSLFIVAGVGLVLTVGIPTTVDAVATRRRPASAGPPRDDEDDFGPPENTERFSRADVRGPLTDMAWQQRSGQGSEYASGPRGRHH